MAFTLASFMPKTTLKLPTFKTYQQPRKGSVLVTYTSAGATGRERSIARTESLTMSNEVKESADKTSVKRRWLLQRKV
ncbi:hypothetical protein CUMW_196510 [Citrus unshiu]|uniref:Uncharacterized protein n=1 Tax=Citrus unshiu TaxID=55188 RepID=A0A2H5Q4Y2_CITUN|nr:hypothetical protein CUMW_196510 [Citrus unshiu]